MKIKNTVFSAFLGMICAMFFSCAGNTFCAESQWDSVTEGVWQDPETKDFHFKSVDKKRQSETFYRTQGFTIADAYKDANGNIVETGTGEFNWPLDDPRNDYTERELGNGIIETEWVIPYEVVMEQIKATSPEWYDRVMNPNGEVYLKLDAIIAVNDPNKYLVDPESGEAFSGMYLPTLGWVGQFWDKYNMQQLYDLYGWDPSYFDNHFDQALVIAAGLASGDLTLDDLLDMGIDEETAKKMLEELRPDDPDPDRSPEEYADFKSMLPLPI